MKTVRTIRVADTADAVVLPDLPEEIALALADIAGAAREGLLAMSVAAGMAVMQALFEAEIAEVAGPKGKHDPNRAAVRHGSGRGSVTLGGRRVAVDRPRARTVDGQEVPLASYTHFAAEDVLTRVVMERMLAGVATRRHARVVEPVGAVVDKEAKSTSRSAISRRFVKQTETALAELMARDLTGEDIKVLMLDGEHMAEPCVVVALAITANGTKKPIGLMEPHRNERKGLHRPSAPSRIPRSIPDEEFNEIFARLPSHRDRALVAFYVSTGARASELLSATQGGVDPGRGVITVTRKGSRAIQELPASSDAFVWLRLCQVEIQGRVPHGRHQPLWWTSRTPLQPLTYHAVHRMFERAGQAFGSTATLHALRHTAAYRMAEDPDLPLTDVQFVMGHALLTTTQIYLTPRKQDVIRRILAHHAQQMRKAAERVQAPPAPGYRPETLQVLFGGNAR